jgi:CHAT domain-containing protein
VADAQHNLALVLSDLGRDDEAKALLDEALNGARQRRDVLRQADSLAELGALAQRSGEAGRAASLYRAASQAYATVGRTRAVLGLALNQAALTATPAADLEDLVQRAVDDGDRRLIARAHLVAAQGIHDPKTASGHAEEALLLAHRMGLAAVEWQALHVRGALALDGGKRRKGLADLRAAAERLERSRRALSGEDARVFARGHEAVYQRLIDALLTDGDTAGAMLYAERLQRTALPTAPETAQGGDVQSLIDREAWLEGELAAERAEGPENSERALALERQLAELRVRFAAAVDELRASHAELDRLVRMAPEDLEAVQADLEPGVTVLQPVVLPDRLVLLLLSRDTLRAVSVAVTGEELEGAVDRYTRALGSGSRDAALARAFGDKLGAWLVAPIAEYLARTRVLVVSTSGDLRRLPFAILRHDGGYLAEQMAVVGVTHVGSLQRRSEAGRYHLAPQGTLLLGNPDGTLPGAQAEVEALEALLPGSTAILGAAATREALLAQSRGKTTVHLATHGRIDPTRPERSHLVLAGGDDKGRLAYGEIPGLAPALRDARLVVLSACESSVPISAEPGPEGASAVSIHGLAAQFRRAGVETLVGSLWRVDDRATLELMQALYEELAQGADLARALQSAQKRLIGHSTYGHPLYWGAFVLVGDWR